MIKTLKLFFRASMVLLMALSLRVQADALDDIMQQKSLRVGVSLFVPWTMEDSAGQLSGFEIDVANEIARDMGVEAKFTVYEWDNIVAALLNGEIDLIAGGMAITPARALKLNFSLPYADSGISLIANTAKTQGINGLEDANKPEIKFAVVAESAASDLASSLFNNATVMTYKTADEAAAAVVSGAVHAMLASSPQPEFLALKHPETLDLPLTKPLLSYKAGLAVQKGQQEWLNFLNAWVTARTADHWLAATHKYWFKSVDWRPGTQ